MEDEYYDFNPYTNPNLVEDHEWLNDLVYESHLLPGSTSEKFQFALDHKNSLETHFIVKYDMSKELMYIVSVCDNSRCTLNITEAQLNYHLHRIGFQKLIDYLLEFEIKVSYGPFSKYKKVESERFKLNELISTEEDKSLIDLLLNTRYAASKATGIYHHLQNS